MPSYLYLRESPVDPCAFWINGPITFPLRFGVTKAAILNPLKIDRYSGLCISSKVVLFLRNMKFGSSGWYYAQRLIRKNNVDTNINHRLGRSFASVI